MYSFLMNLLNNKYRSNQKNTCDTVKIESKQVSFNVIQHDQTTKNLFTIYSKPRTDSLNQELVSNFDKLSHEISSNKIKYDETGIIIDDINKVEHRMTIKIVSKTVIKYKIIYSTIKEFFDENTNFFMEMFLFNLSNYGIEYKVGNIFFVEYFFLMKTYISQTFHNDGIARNYLCFTYIESSHTTELLFDYKKTDNKCPILRFKTNEDYLTTLAVNNHEIPYHAAPSHSKNDTASVRHQDGTNCGFIITNTNIEQIDDVEKLRKVLLVTIGNRNEDFYQHKILNGIEEKTFVIGDLLTKNKINFIESENKDIVKDGVILGYETGNYFYVKQEYLNSYVIDVQNMNDIHIGGKNNKCRRRITKTHRGTRRIHKRAMKHKNTKKNS